MTDMTLTDSTTADMGAFMNRHERRTRRLFFALTAISLLVSVGAFTYGVLEFGSPGAIPGRLWFAILFYPLPIIFLWIVSVGMSRKRPKLPGGSLPMNPDDARNTATVANAGAVFVAGVSVVCIASQAGMVLNTFHALPPLNGMLLSRAMIVAVGALMVYFGNAYPRLPTPRAAEHKPATKSRFNRFYGWMVVIHGLLFVLVGLLLPGPHAFAKGAAVVSLSILLFAAGWVLMYIRAVKSPSAA